jgi:hypothetical protein
MRTYVAYINFLFASYRGHADKKYSAPYTRPSQRVQRMEFLKNYCAINSSSPEVELRFCPWLILFKY